MFWLFKSKVKEIPSKQCLHRMRLWGSILIGREGAGVCLKDVFSWQVNCVQCVCLLEWPSSEEIVENYSKSEAPPHSWYCHVLRQSESKNYLKMCSFCTYVKKLIITLGKFLKTVTWFSFRKTFDRCFILSYFIEDPGRIFHNHHIPD